MTQPASVTSGSEEAVKRIQSLVPGLDAILCGGFLRGGQGCLTLTTL
jgi:hypothetical protein